MGRLSDEVDNAVKRAVDPYIKDRSITKEEANEFCPKVSDEVSRVPQPKKSAIRTISLACGERAQSMTIIICVRARQLYHDIYKERRDCINSEDESEPSAYTHCGLTLSLRAHCDAAYDAVPHHRQR